jgi:hypothetical protein
MPRKSRNLSASILNDARLLRLRVRYGPRVALTYTWLITLGEDDGSLPDLDDLALQLYHEQGATSADVAADVDHLVHAGLLRSKDHHLYFPPETWYKHQAYIATSRRRMEPPDSRENSSAAHKGAQERTSARHCSAVLTMPPTTPQRQQGGGGAGGGGYSEDFERFWAAYPRKREKRAAWACWLARTNGKGNGPKASAEQLLAAGQRYGAAMADEDPKYIKLARTFLGPHAPYEDWLPGANGSVPAAATAPRKKGGLTAREIAAHAALLAEEDGA